jgi:GNAT superfamily N-acetyltransferase
VTYRIRLARDEETQDECRELCRQFFPESSQPGPDSLWWAAHLAEHPEEIAAFASARLLDDGAVLLNSAGVLREHRGHGLQKRLIRARCRWAAKHAPTKAVVTYTMASNARSANSLIACGFRQYVPAHPWFGCAEDVVYWLKRLEARP